MDTQFFDAAQNARLVANAEKFYRVMYFSSRESWNLRDSHMFDTLRDLLAYRGEGSKAVVWAHNSHIGDASATEMGARQEHNIGQLCREKLEDRTYHIGFGTDHGTVAAASYWDGSMEVMDVRPGLEGSYEWLYHSTGIASFLLPLGSEHIPEGIRRQLLEQRLERAIGVIYRPQTELQSHYFQAIMPRQFDELIWFDETHAVRPVENDGKKGVPATFPFGL
jgi:erythromycin esterase-like protein